MKLIESYWEWIKEPEEWIEVAGRTCYKSEDKITKDSSEKFIKMLRKCGHGAMLEHSMASVRFVTNRGFTHELVRHRVASFAQESTRYVKYGDLNIIIPVWWSWMELMAPITIDSEGRFPIVEDAEAHAINIIEKAEIDYGHLKVLGAFNLEGSIDQKRSKLIAEITVWLYSHMISEWSYTRQLDCGARLEQARGVLPNDLKTEIIITCNLREWRHIFSLRCAKAAHPQIRVMMKDLLISFNRRMPSVFGDLHDAFIEK